MQHLQPGQQRHEHRNHDMDALVAKVFGQETPLQRSIAEGNVKAGLPAIHIGALEGRLLEVLLLASGAKNGVEIGTLGGYSGTWLARALPADGKLITIEKDAVRAERARANFLQAGLADRVEVRTGAAQDVLRNLNALKDLDFVFVDADKQSYGEYVQWAIPRLRKGGLLICDNAYLWGGMQHYGASEAPSERFSHEDFQGMSACWKLLAEHPQLKSIIIPTGEGLALAVKV